MCNFSILGKFILFFPFSCLEIRVVELFSSNSVLDICCTISVLHVLKTFGRRRHEAVLWRPGMDFYHRTVQLQFLFSLTFRRPSADFCYHSFIRKSLLMFCSLNLCLPPFSSWSISTTSWWKLNWIDMNISILNVNHASPSLVVYVEESVLENMYHH